MIINLFEIAIKPEIAKLYVTDAPAQQGLFKDKLFVRASQDSIVSIEPLHNSRPLFSGLEQYVRWLIKEHFFNQVEKSELFFNVNRKGGTFAVLNESLYRDEYLSILREVTVRFYFIKERYYLAVLPKTAIYNRISLKRLLSDFKFKEEFFLKHNRCLVYIERDGMRGWHAGYIKSLNGSIKVEIPQVFNGTISVESNRIIPKLNKSDYSFDQVYFQKITKIAKEKSSISSKQLLAITEDIVARYIRPILNSPEASHTLILHPKPLSLANFSINDLSTIDNQSHYIFPRDGNVFTDSKRFQGLSNLSLDKTKAKPQNVVLFGTNNTIEILDKMVNDLNDGVQKGNYVLDMPSKFGIRLNVVDRYITDDYSQYLEECKKFIFSVEEKHKNALAIAYLPEHSALYHEFKAKLAAHGKVSQIRSKSNLDIYTAWNIATNIFAKLSFTPWTISESTQIENADLILGFSYSSLNVEGKLKRNIGYVNVWDKKGEWKFMRSHLGILDFNNREKIIADLVQEAIHSFMAGGISPSIIDIHYSKRFSKNERKKVFDATLKILPNVKKVNFISIDETHSLRVFDDSTRYYNLKKGTVVFLRDDEFILSVLGNDSNEDAFRQLKVIVHTEGEKSSVQNNLSIAQRILAMTKLNWRSVVKDSSEPVTLKYSSEIAKLTNHFSLTEWNTVSTNLSNIPWFI